MTMSKRTIQHKASRQDKAYKLEQWRLAGAKIAAAAAISGRGSNVERPSSCETISKKKRTAS